MRRAHLETTRDEALQVLDEVPYAHLAWSQDDQAHLRALHVVRVGDQVVFHGAASGEKMMIVDREVVLEAEEVLCSVPSYFTDPQRACPATTFYRSVQVRGVVRVVEDPGLKALAMGALMRRFQPEGKYRALDPHDPLYANALATVAILALPLEQVTGKSNLAQSKPEAVRAKIVQGLWQRGAVRDPEVIERLRAAVARDPGRDLFVAPTGYTAHVWAPPGEAAAVARALSSQYWNVGVSQEELVRAHLDATAWVVAREAGGRIVATARAVSDGAKHAWIYDVWTDEAHRGRGVAQALLRVLLGHPRVRGAKWVHLLTKDAQGLYRKLGFEDRGPARNPEMVRGRREFAIYAPGGAFS